MKARLYTLFSVALVLTLGTLGAFAVEGGAPTAQGAFADFLNQAQPLLISAFVPLVVVAIKKKWAGFPKWLLPLSAPLIGVAGDSLIQWVSGWSLAGGPVEAAMAGMAGVFVREVVNQTRKALV